MKSACVRVLSIIELKNARWNIEILSRCLGSTFWSVSRVWFPLDSLKISLRKLVMLIQYFQLGKNSHDITRDRSMWIFSIHFKYEYLCILRFFTELLKMFHETLFGKHCYRNVAVGSCCHQWISRQAKYTGCFTTCGHYCMRWFPRSLWSKKFI